MEERVARIVDLARLAPSGENAQPWRFAVEEQTVEVVNVPEADRSLYNLGQRGSLVGHGCLLETISIAASAEGVRADVDLFPADGRQDAVARVMLAEARVERDPLHSAIASRCTNRKPYAAEPLGQEEREQLLLVEGIRLAEEPETVRRLAAAAAANEEVALANRNLHGFLFESIAWTAEEERSRGRGLLVDTLELPPEALPTFKRARSWPRVWLANRFGFARKIAAVNAGRYRAAAAIGAVVVPGGSREHHVEAGRRFQRLWLTATQLGLSLQPLTGICFLHEAVAAGDDHRLPRRHVELVKRAYNEIAGTLAGDGQTIPVLFRIGRGGEPSARSSRLPLHALLL